ncbi:dehydrogenase/reductase SDR family member 7-like [Dermacentor andersoni]|uniref:dehydrogenase/reductase SDR family member 7-like n=1 Tax=Dermacentor andersoni TaxID=34620 RepID=UPI0021550BCA|nr:dehydrogenase/reductase SDR family member 7-like [Dermacentor andersoni]
MLCCAALGIAALGVAALAAVAYWFRYYTDACWSLIFAEHFGTSPATLRRQVAWITGAGSGLGRATALELASHGVKVVLSDVDEQAVEDVKYTLVAQELLSERDVLVLSMDVTKFDEHPKLFEKVLERFGRLDILVNCAGRSQSARFQDISMEVHKAMFELNVFSHVHLTQTVIPHWLERRSGHVVVITSVASKIALPDSATYNATKAALHGYFEGLWSEVFDKGINVTLVCPGPVATPIRQKCFSDVLGKTESFKPAPAGKSNKMAPSRAAQLIVLAVANKLDEIWFGPQPFVVYAYLAQYFPTIFRRRVVPSIYQKDHIAKLRDG